MVSSTRHTAPPTLAERSAPAESSGRGPATSVGGENDIYTDPKIANSVIATAVRDDPLFRFLAHSWRSLLVVLLAVVAGWYAWNGFKSTRDESVRHSADLFARMRADYEETLTLRREQARLKKEITELEAKGPAATSAGTGAKDGKKEEGASSPTANLAEKRSRLEKVESDLPTAIARARQSAVALRDARPPYSELTPLYLTLIGREEGASDVQAQPAASWRDAKEGERLIRELEWYAFARSMLDGTPSQEQRAREEGRGILKELASEGTYVRAPAALVLARTANGENERATARELLLTIQRDQPDQSEFINSELRRLQ